MATQIQKVREHHPEYRGERGLRRLAQQLVMRLEAPPPETALAPDATREEQKAAAKIGRAWHIERTAHYQQKIERMLAGNAGELDNHAREHIAEMLGLPRGAGADLHKPIEIPGTRGGADIKEK